MPTINVRPSEHVSVLTESISLPILSLTPNASCPGDPFSEAYLHIIPAIVNTDLNIVSVMIHERCIGKRGDRFFSVQTLSYNAATSDESPNPSASTPNTPRKRRLGAAPCR